MKIAGFFLAIAWLFVSNSTANSAISGPDNSPLAQLRKIFDQEYAHQEALIQDLRVFLEKQTNNNLLADCPAIRSVGISIRGESVEKIKILREVFGVSSHGSIIIDNNGEKRASYRLNIERLKDICMLVVLLEKFEKC